MAKKIKLTENQLKNVVNVLSEENFDQALTTHQREKEREVFMSGEDAKLLADVGTKWCEDKVSHPECESLMAIIKKLKLDRL